MEFWRRKVWKPATALKRSAGSLKRLTSRSLSSNNCHSNRHQESSLRTHHRQKLLETLRDPLRHLIHLAMNFKAVSASKWNYAISTSTWRRCSMKGAQVEIATRVFASGTYLSIEISWWGIWSPSETLKTPLLNLAGTRPVESTCGLAWQKRSSQKSQSNSTQPRWKSTICRHQFG